MPEVYNWQLGRTMAYQYDAGRPKRQIAWVFDTNKCIACQTCTVACKQTWTWGRGQEYMLWNNVETKPYGFFPTGWDVRLLEMLGPGGWQDGEYEGQTVAEAAPQGERVRGWLPESEHWAYPACLAACPREAIYKRPEDGIVLVDQSRCRGYQECVSACPYKKVMFNLETRVSEK